MAEEELFGKLCELDKYRMELVVRKGLLELARRRYTANIALMRRMDTCMCPHCAQTISEDEIMTRITRLNETIPTYDEPIRQAEQECEEATENWRKVRTYPQAPSGGG